MPKSKEITVSEDPRERMKQIRTEIAHAVKNGQRIDKLIYNKADTARAFIALQDLLDASNTAHRKATAHVASQKEIIEGIAMMTTLVMNDCTARNLSNQAKVADLVKQNADLLKEIHRLDQGWQEANQGNLELHQKLAKRGAQLDSALHTLKTVFDQDEPVYEYAGSTMMTVDPCFTKDMEEAMRYESRGDTHG